MGGRQPHRGGTQLKPVAASKRGPSGPVSEPPARHWAEELAERALLAKGYTLLRRNYRLRGGEIDLVLRAPVSTVVFVEVRQRRSSAYGGAAGSISAAKRRRVRRAAGHFLATVLRSTDVAVRFDVVLVTGDGPRAKLVHVEDAF